MARWAGVQNVSRPMERCQEMSHWPPIIAEVTPKTAHQTYQGTRWTDSRTDAAETDEIVVVVDAMLSLCTFTIIALFGFRGAGPRGCPLGPELGPAASQGRLFCGYVSLYAHRRPDLSRHRLRAEVLMTLLRRTIRAAMAADREEWFRSGGSLPLAWRRNRWARSKRLPSLARPDAYGNDFRSTPPTLVFPTIPRHRKLFQKERQARPKQQPIQTRSAAKSRAGAGSETGAIRPRLVAPTPDLGAQPWAIEFRVTTVTVFATNVSLCIDRKSTRL